MLDKPPYPRITLNPQPQTLLQQKTPTPSMQAAPLDLNRLSDLRDALSTAPASFFRKLSSVLLEYSVQSLRKLL